MEAQALNWENLPSGTEDREDRVNPEVYGNPISLSDEPKPISLGPKPQPTSSDYANKKAEVASFGLADKLMDKSYADYFDPISRGMEPELRRSVSGELDLLDQRNLAEHITDFPHMAAQMIMSQKKHDAESVFEQQFADKWVENLYASTGYSYSPFSSYFSDDVANNPTQVKQVTDLGKDLITKKMYLQHEKDQAEEAASKQSWTGYLKNLGYDLLSLGLYSEIRPRLESSGPFLAGLGTAQEEMWNRLYTLPMPQFQREVQRMKNDLKDDPQMWNRFVEAGIGRGDNEVLFDNAMTALNLGSLVPLSRTISATKSLVRGTASIFSKGAAVSNQAAIGDLAETAVRRETNALVHKAQGTFDYTKDGLEQLPSGMQTHVIGITADNPGNFGAEAANRMREYFDSIQKPLMELLQDWRANRLPLVASSEELQRTLRQETLARFPHLSDRVLNMVYRADPISNTHWFDMIIGRNTAEYIGSSAEAEGIAKMLHIPLKGEKPLPVRGEGGKFQSGGERIVKPGDTGAIIDNKDSGTGWYIRYPVPISLKGEAAINAMVPLDERIDEMGKLLNSTLIGRGRTPEETVTSLSAMINRKIAQYGPSKFIDLLRSAMKPMEEIYPGMHPFRRGIKNKWADFEQLLADAQTMHNPDTNKQGYFFKSPDELEYWYRRNKNRSPDMDEVMAYSAFKMLNEMDRMFRTISVVRDKNNAGTMRHVIRVKGGATPEFEATRLAEFPGGKDEDIVLIWKDGTTRVKTLGRPWGIGTNIERFKENVKNGKGTVLEMWNQYHKPLQGFGSLTDKDLIRYVYTEQPVESRAISWTDQVPRQGGGHLGNEYPRYLKQAMVSRDPTSGAWHYHGDKTIAAGQVNSDLEWLANHLNKASELMVKGDKAAAKQYFLDNKLPLGFDEFEGHTRPKKNPMTGKIEQHINLEEPFRVVPANRMIGDVDTTLRERYEKRGVFKDGTKGGSLASQAVTQFTGERDVYELHALENMGTRDRPLYQLNPAKFIDAIPMLTRAGDRIVNSLYMDDVKAYEAQRWLKNAEKYMKDGTQIWYYPWSIFHAPEGEFKAGTPPEIKALLMDDWRKINQFTGITGKFTAFMDSISQRMADSISGKFDPKLERWVTSKDSILSPTWIAHNAPDIPQKMRSFVYHTKMGLFNIPQFLVHAFTYVNVAAIAGPTKAAQGATAAWFHLLSTYDHSPEFLAHLDQLATKVGWRPGEWMEARELMLASGMKNFEGEHYLKDTLKASNIIMHRGQQMLDWGGMFFRGGARSVRVASHYTAYKEFRDGGGGVFKWAGKAAGELSRDEQGIILQRADLLSHNMGRASSSILQKGMLSFGSQFAGYNMRLLEMLTGKRLTGFEKARLFGTYALLYGVPATGGLAFMNEYLREAAYKNEMPYNMFTNKPYVIGDNFLSSFINEGLLSTIGAEITGKGNLKDGIFYNVGERYGAHDLDIISKLISTDKGVLDIFGGASYSTFSNLWESKNGFLRFAGDWIRGTGEYKLTGDDIERPLKEVASYNAYTRFRDAFHLGRQLSKRGDLLEDKVGKLDAAFRAFTGLQNQKAADAYVYSQMIHNQETGFKDLEREAREQMHRGYTAYLNNDPVQAAQYHKNAERVLVLGGYPADRMHRFFSNSAHEYQDQIHRLWDRWNNKDVPDKSISLNPFSGFSPKESPLEDRQEMQRRQGQ